MKNKTLIASLVVVFSLFLVACGNGDSEEARAESSVSSKSNEIVTIGSLASDANIWEYIAKSDAASEAGLIIKVEHIDDGVQLNKATAGGTVDVNAFQSVDYLNSFNEQTDESLVPLATTYLEPMGIYSDKYKSIEEIPEGATIAIADNPSNASRGLRLVEEAGLIRLSEDFDALGTVDDIVENPKNLVFEEIDDHTGPRILRDVDAALISNTQALEGGLNVLEDAIFREEPSESTRGNINILATTSENADNETFKKLGHLYHDEEIQTYIAEEFDGTKVPVNKPVDSFQ